MSRWPASIRCRVARVGALLVVDEDARHVDAGDILVEQHDVPARPDQGRQRAVVGGVGHHHEAIDMAVVQPVEAVDLAPPVAAGRRHEDGVAVPLGLVLDGGGELGEERLADFGDDEADRLGLPGREALGEKVRPVVELCDRGIDARGGRRRQLDAVVEVARDGGGGDPGVVGNVVDRRHR